MSDRTPADEELLTARLSLRRPTKADIEAITLRPCEPSPKAVQRSEPSH
ncbi:hypothetical protein ACH4GM_34505 [Streptomyces coeruleorubidus]